MFAAKTSLGSTSAVVPPDHLVYKILSTKNFIKRKFDVMPHVPINVDIN